MKTFKHIASMMILIGIGLAQGNPLNAQDNAYYRKDVEQFRVVAVKEGDVSTTSISNVVELNKATTFFMPNAFTPDNDGVNDTFGMTGQNVKDFKMQIFNRWGEVLFESNNPNDRWDGTYQGDKVQEGVYVYTVEGYRALSGKRIQKTGTVTVLL